MGHTASMVFLYHIVLKIYMYVKISELLNTGHSELHLFEGRGGGGQALGPTDWPKYHGIAELIHDMQITVTSGSQYGLHHEKTCFLHM